MGIYVAVKNVTKIFRDAKALDNVSLSFEAGQIHGIIGRNGSGKTVLLKCICGLVSPTQGEILIDGKPVKPGRAQKEMGVIIESPGFINTYSGIKNLTQLAALWKRIDKETVIEKMRLVGLDPNSKKAVGKYSLGMRQRLGLAQAIMEDPKLIILDEPMNGLDNQGVIDIRNILLQLKEEGKTILLASHSKEDIKALCDTVCELDHGTPTAFGKAELMRQSDRDTLSL